LRVASHFHQFVYLGISRTTIPGYFSTLSSVCKVLLNINKHA